MKLSISITCLAIALLLTNCSPDVVKPYVTGTIGTTVLNNGTSTGIADAVVTTSPSTSTMQTDQAGHAVFEDVAPGTYVVKAMKDSVHSDSMTVDVIAGETVLVTLTLGVAAPQDTTHTDSTHTDSTNSITRGLIAHYPLDGTPDDISSNHFNGHEIEVAWMPDRHGNPHGCARFTGGYSFIRVPHDTKLNSFPLTVSFWINPTMHTPNQRILGKYLFPEGEGWVVFFESGLFVADYMNNMFNYFTRKDVQPPQVDTWTHVTSVFDEAGVRVYYNGKFVGSSPCHGSLTNSTLPGPFYMGSVPGTQDVNGFAEGFKGMLDDVKIFNRALSADEVTALAVR